MIVYITNRKMEILECISTELKENVPVLFEDKETKKVDAGIATFEGTVCDTTKSVEEGNFIIYEDEDGRTNFYTIMTTDKSRKEGEITFYAEDAGLDLLNKVIGDVIAGEELHIDYYIRLFAQDSGFEVGINEAQELTRKIIWTGSATATKRLIALAEEFGVELYFSFVIEEMKITHKYINIVKKVGNDIGVVLKYGTDIDNITTSGSILNLATALDVTGGTLEGKSKPITLEGYAYDDGRFYVDGRCLKDRESVKKWSRYLSETGTGEGHITVLYTHNTTSQSELCQKSIEELKKRSEVEVNYKVDIAILPQGVRVGDTVTIVDEEREQYLSARILQLERSRSKDTSVATLGNYLILKNGISQKIQEFADKIASLKSGQDAVAGYLTSEAVTLAADEVGTVTDFSNANGIFKVIRGQAQIDASDLSFSVSENTGCTANINDDGIYAVTAMTADMATVTFTALYNSLYVTKTLTLSKAKKGIQGTSGATTYTWVKYGTSSAGAGLNDSPTGMTYIGLAFNKTTAVESTVATDYSWSLMKGADSLSYWLVMSNYTVAKSITGAYTPGTITASLKYTVGATAPTAYSGRFIIADTTNGTTYTDRYTSTANESSKVYTPLAGIKGLRIRAYLAGGTTTLVDEAFVSIVSDGATGNPGATGPAGILVSATAPTSPTAGQLWQDTSVNPNILRQWNGSEWIINTFSAVNIIAETLAAITANLGEVTAGKLRNAASTFILDLANGTIQSGSADSLFNVKFGDGTVTYTGQDPWTDHVSIINTCYNTLYQNLYTNKSVELKYEDDNLTFTGKSGTTVTRSIGLSELSTGNVKKEKQGVVKKAGNGSIEIGIFTLTDVRGWFGVGTEKTQENFHVSICQATNNTPGNAMYAPVWTTNGVCAVLFYAPVPSTITPWISYRVSMD